MQLVEALFSLYLFIAIPFLHYLLQISKQTPDIHVSIENEGHDHAFSCSKAGSIWVAQHVASLIKKHTAGHVVSK